MDLELTKIALTFVVAIFAAMIAHRQSLTAQSKLRLDLFEKRWAVYRATQNIILALNRQQVTPVAHQDFARAIQGARWLFDEPTSVYLYSILDKLTLYLLYQQRIAGHDEEGPARNEDVDRSHELFLNIASQSEGRNSPLDKMLGPFLTIDQPTLVARIGKWLRRLLKERS